MDPSASVLTAFAPVFLGLDLGGTKLHGVLLHGDRVLASRRTAVSPSSFEALIHECAALARELAGHSPVPPSALGAAIAGALDARAGVMHLSPNLPCLNGKNLRLALESACKLPVVLENDANAYAVAEHRLGAGAGCRNLVALTLGTGIGGGVIVNDTLLTGADGVGAELGHWQIKFDGPPCACGRHGCIEAYLSGTGLVRAYREGHPDHTPTARELFERHRAGDPDLAELFDEYFEVFGIALGNLITVFNPERLVLGGSIAQQPAIWQNGVGRVARHRFTDRARVEIVPGTLGDEAGAVGGALIAARTCG